MRQSLKTLVVATNGKGLVEITGPVLDWVSGTGIGAGLLTLFCRHTSASLLIQENADPDVKTDLAAFFERVAPEHSRLYAHDAEGPDDMPAHIRSALTQSSLVVPVVSGRPLLGTWQGLYLFEHRAKPHRREIAIHLIGD